ncbi:MAG TPA: hypothetical protein VG247_30690 [Pseudonocardiaceae bacterium]|jgi:hypothetical protein|nr:hypothetical protein [Pseudonocardiaceae bacterium]
MVTATAPAAQDNAEGKTRGTVLAGLPTNLAASLRGFAATTPGRLSVAMVGLILLSLLTGIVGIFTGQTRVNTLDDLTQHREPVSAAAQQIYRALSDADATAASAFLSGAVEPDNLRAQYNADIAQAGAALAVAATDSADTANVQDVVPSLTVLETDLPVYTGIVERAAANNAEGYPVGSAYLREADGLMQNTLLPAARNLYKTDITSLDAQQDEATSVPWVGAVLLLALLVALFLTQRFLARRTNRMLNIGLLVASIAMVLTLLWSAVGLILTGVHVSNARSSGSDLVAQLSQARTDALQARSDEILNLVARGGENYDPQFHSLANELGGKDGTGGLLGAVQSTSQDQTMSGEIDNAISAAKSWFAEHNTVQNLNNTGDYPNAVSETLSSASDGEATMVAKLDNALDKAITQGRTVFADETNSASAALFGWPIGVLVLAVLAAVGSAIGIWQRLREYR